MSYDSRDTEWMARSGHDPRTRAIAITKFAEGYERIKEMYPGIRAEHDELEKICTHTLYNNQPLVTYTPGKDKYRDILPCELGYFGPGNTDTGNGRKEEGAFT